MTTEVKLPDIGEGVTEGEMVKWLVNVGDFVSADQPIAEVMTDKATVEVPSPQSGTVKELKAQEGDIIPIETTLLVLEASSDGSTTKSSPTTLSTQKSSPATPPSISASVAQASVNGVASSSSNAHLQAVFPPVVEDHVLATPGTRRLAREMSLDLNNVHGTGPLGRVTREDVLKAQAVSAPTHIQAASQLKAPKVTSLALGERETREPLRGIRRKIAEQMQMTKQIVPHFTLMDEANVTELVKLRTQAKNAGERVGIKVTYLPFIMKALISTIKEFPMFNASIDDANQEIVYKNYFNIGFACDTPQGLLVPVIKDADQKTILELSQEVNLLAEKGRQGKLSLEEMKGASISITNIGSVGGTYATPIINHPEVAILGVYKMQDKPIYKDGKFRAAKVMNYTITCDHRLIDGAVAANFLRSFFQRIENPSQLMLEMR